MGKPVANPYGKNNDVYPYPSHYGSHAKMLDEEVTGHLVQVEEIYTEYAIDESGKNVPKPMTRNKFVVCKDENGNYVTELRNLDNGLADPYRNSSVEHREKALMASIKVKK